jgi:hypothetical protein
MDPRFRPIFNASFSDAFYRRYLDDLSRRLGCAIPFPVAETPFFIPPLLAKDLADSARAIVAQITRPELLARLERAIPDRFRVPGQDALPSCIQVDFAIVRDEDGELAGRVVELQAFPSLYALMVVQSEVLMEHMRREMPGLEGPFSIYFGGLERDAFVERLRRAVVAGEDPAEVVLLDIDPPSQKTFPDFAATKLLVGVDAVCPTALTREGRRLFREVGGKKVQVRRIYNRVVFDELERKGTRMPFSYTDELDVTWCSHPNWYWTFSKYTLPYVDHPAVPRARTVASLDAIPADLERYVLKPLFSFAGAGVVVDPTRADVERIPEGERESWLLQEKIVYEPGIPMPEGIPNRGDVKAEVRMMFLRAPDQPEPELVLNLVRLSRGKMLGVDQNKDLSWVGGTVGLMTPPTP